MTMTHVKHFFRFLAFVFCLLAVSAQAADDSPLFEAVKKGDKAEVEALLAKGADVNAKDKYGDAPLHLAASNGKKDIAELLLDKGADVNAKGLYGTPLHVAVKEWKKDIVELLLSKGADVNAKGTHGTPLHYAAEYGRKDIAELLLAKGADINAKDEFVGGTPLRVAEKSTGYHAGRLGLPGDNVYFRAMLRGEYTTRKETLDLLEEHLFKQVKLNPRAGLVQLTAQLKDQPGDTGVRRLILKLAGEMKPAPAIPEEARRHFIEGSAMVKAGKNPAQQALAAQSFTEALKIAPWWGDAYYNLGVAQELAEKYDEAEQAFNFYLLSNPGEKDKREVQDRIYALAAKRRLLGAK